MIKHALPAFLLLSLCAVTQAEQEYQGFYLGPMLAHSNSDEDSPYYQLEESTLGGGVLMGYNFNENLGLEGNLLSFTYNSFISHSATVAPKTTLVLNDSLSLYAKLGLAATWILTDEKNDGDSWAIADNSAGFGMTFGMGLNIAVNQSTYVRLSYDFIQSKLEDSDNLLPDTDRSMNIFGTGIYFQF